MYFVCVWVYVCMYECVYMYEPVLCCIDAVYKCVWVVTCQMDVEAGGRKRISSPSPLLSFLSHLWIPHASSRPNTGHHFSLFSTVCVFLFLCVDPFWWWWWWLIAGVFKSLKRPILPKIVFQILFLLGLMKLNQ